MTEPDSRSELPTDIDWSPVEWRGSSFRTHILVFPDSDTALFKRTIRSIAFDMIFVVLALIATVVAYRALGENDFIIDKGALVGLGITLMIIGIAVAQLLPGRRRVVFDRRRGYYWKGHKDPEASDDKRGLKNFAELKDIVGLQIVPRRLRSGRSFELNLVLKGSSRLNVVSHGDEKRLMADARELAEFLDVPLLTR